VDEITLDGCLHESLRHQTIVISVEELSAIVKTAEYFELEIPEKAFENIPTDFVLCFLASQLNVD
jgi:hypothetical protein